MSERGRDSEVGQCWLPKRLFRVSAEIHSHFPLSSPSACTAAPQHAACWHRGSTLYTLPSVAAEHI